LEPTLIVATVVALIVGGVLGYMRKGQDVAARLLVAEDEARRIQDNAKLLAETTRKKAELEAREISIKEVEKFEQETRQERNELQEWERRLRTKEESLDRRLEAAVRKDEDFEARDRGLAERERTVHGREESIGKQLAAIDQKLVDVAGLSREEARRQLIEAVEADARMDMARHVKAIEEETREQADRKAKRIIALAVQRYAGEYVAEKTVSVVQLPNEEMKGRIIGREGRNIRALEAATGIDLIIDDTPEAVVLSGFSPLRREIARISLERLIADGRIHPSRIEEVVTKVKEEIEDAIRESGEQATFELGLNGIHSEILRLIGQLKYRTSYGQNQFQHSLEVGHLAGLMAMELGLNVKIATRAGLLHDIGKVIDQSVEGSHAVIGAEFAQRYGEAPKIVNAIAAHHEEVPMESIYSVLVQAADALSGARPGARREILESYIRRLEDLERISNAFEGVEKSYAIQAGRELRIIVSNNGVSDAEAVMMSRNIARKIESELTYPGQIKVTVIRETRAVDFAR